MRVKLISQQLLVTETTFTYRDNASIFPIDGTIPVFKLPIYNGSASEANIMQNIPSKDKV